MIAFAFKLGVAIKIKGTRYTFGSRWNRGPDEGWQIIEAARRLVETKTDSELEALYVRGDLVLDVESLSPEQYQHLSRPSAKLPIADHPSKSRDFVKNWVAALKYVPEHLPVGAGKEQWDRIVREVKEKCGLKKFSRASYYRWREQWGPARNNRNLIPAFEERGGRTDQIHPHVAAIMDEVFDAAVEAALAGDRSPSPLVSMTAMRADVLARIEGAGLSADLLASLATFYRRWNKIPAERRLVAKHGVIRARALLRSVKGHDRPKNALDIVQYDETELPFYVIDDDTGVPFGVPAFCFSIDVFSQYPHGMALGFEPPGDMMLHATMKHAILPKTYMEQEYSNIHHRWLAYGIPRGVIPDNSGQAQGRSHEQLALELSYDIIPHDAYTPWIKGTVEQTFRTIAQMILRDLPGYKLPINFPLVGYDPAKHALIGFRLLVYVLHKWFVDVYAQRKHRLYGFTPHDRFLEGIQNVKPVLPPCATDLDAIFGVVREGVLDHRGVVFENLYYYSENTQMLRNVHGAKLNVLVKINPADLSFVHVRLPKEKFWVKALSLDPAYTKGLSLHQHKIYQRYSREKYGRSDPHAWLRAHHEIRELCAKLLPLNLSIRLNKLIARNMGIHTEHLLADRDISGGIGSPTGPFTGNPLSPFHESLQPELPHAKPRGIERNGSGATDVPQAANEPTRRTAVSKPASVVRRIPAFSSDDSIGT
jgi:putative transposase